MNRNEFDRAQPVQPVNVQPTEPMPNKRSGLKVRSGVHSGAWNCTSCQGEVLGDQLFRPTCSFCQAT